MVEAEAGMLYAFGCALATRRDDVRFAACVLERRGRRAHNQGRRGVLTSKNPSAKPPPITPRRFFGTEFAKRGESALLARWQNERTHWAVGRRGQADEGETTDETQNVSARIAPIAKTAPGCWASA